MSQLILGDKIEIFVEETEIIQLYYICTLWLVPFLMLLYLWYIGLSQPVLLCSKFQDFKKMMNVDISILMGLAINIAA